MNAGITRLVERVGAGSPPCKEQAQTDSLKDASNSTNGNGVHRALFREDLRDDLQGLSTVCANQNMPSCTYAWCGGGHEDQTAEVCGSLVAQSTRRVDESSDTVCLDAASNYGSTPRCCSTGSLFALKEFLLGVGSLGTVIRITKDGCKNGKRDGVIEDGAHGNSRGLDWWEVCHGIG